MSELERFLRGKLAKLPLEVPSLQATEDDDTEELADQLSALTGLQHSQTREHLYEPQSGADYFQEALLVQPRENDSTFRVYFSPPAILNVSEDPHGTVFVFHHGAAFSGLSFAKLAQSINLKTNGESGFLALDARGHGKSRGANEEDLSLTRLSQDLCDVLQEVFPVRSTAPKVVLVGHSMGGPVVVDACSRIHKEIVDVIGLVMLDIVEGSALEALEGMDKYMRSQPTGFDSVTAAIDWHIRTRQINNPSSAVVSVPPLLTPAPANSPNKYLWRTNLRQTQPYWRGWFTDLSSRFLAVKTAKLLVLAGTDRLDTAMTIGQMQGKYQLKVIPDSGHSIQEDVPDLLADLLVDFWRRNDRIDILKHVKKVGQ